MDSVGEVLHVVILFIVTGVVFGLIGYEIGTSAPPGLRATEVIKYNLVCKIGGDKLIMVTPANECICEHVRLRADSMQCR